MDIKPPTKQRPTLKVSETPIVTTKSSQPSDADLSSVLLETPGEFSSEEVNRPNDTTMSRKKLSIAKRIIIIVIATLVLGVAGALGWYKWAISPAGTNETKQSFVVKSGETPSIIASNLENARLIRNKTAFELYIKLQGSSNDLQAGTYKLSPSQSVASIVSELVKGQNATYNVFIPPGLTLKQLADPAVKGSFASQGFSTEEINQAFSATYTSALLKDKPVTASLEGYIFPETFQVKESDSLQSVLERSFDTLYERLQEKGLVEKFASHGLTLHQAVTLASIVQMEVSTVNDQAQVAQVFLKRLNEGVLLGSDVTAVYGAVADGVVLPSSASEAAAIAIAHNSPYNTRMHSGLPPGPIANMNFSALEAVANPAAGDYLYFVAGDGADAGKTFFSRTYEEHQAAVAAHCHTLCSN